MDDDTHGHLHQKTDIISVLMCDEDEATRQLVEGYLKQANGLNFDLQEATDTKQIEMLLETAPPDVVILALNLAGKSMLEWLEEINVKNLAPTIILAADGDELIAVEAMKRGAADYIPKASLSQAGLTDSLVQARNRWSHSKAIEDERIELERMAMFDSLTGLMSRQALMKQLEIEIIRSARYGHPLSVLMVDIDLFKRFNDTYGHLVGDEVIRGVTKSLKQNIRRSDFAGRYGGEEFLLMLPETSLKQALPLAEKLRGFVSKVEVVVEGKTLREVTVSIGVAQFREGDTLDSLLDRSDKGLYLAKEKGRNRVAHIP